MNGSFPNTLADKKGQCRAISTKKVKCSQNCAFAGKCFDQITVFRPLPFPTWIKFVEQIAIGIILYSIE